MANNITIIGLGEIGTSFGLAFKAEGDTFNVIGSDLLKSAEKRAEDNNAVDQIEHNLFDAVRESEVIILAVPADQTQKLLELLGHDLKDNAIVLDCCADKNSAAAWSRQYMTHPENFLGIWLGTNPDYFEEYNNGGGSAHTDLFKGGSMFIASEAKTSEAAIQLASALAKLLGMECSFAEPLELDGLIAAAYQFPTLAAYGMLECLKQRSGWTDGKKAAGKTFFQMTSPISQKMDQEEIGTSLLNNRENTVRLLNEYIAVLKQYRDALQSKDESELRNIIENNEKALDQWFQDYHKSNLAAEKDSQPINVTAADTIGQTFFGGLLRRKQKN